MLTKIDRKSLAILYCLYGHEKFIWVNKGKFQWYFGVTYRAKNRLVKLGLLEQQEMQYAQHWLAYRDVCRVSDEVVFDDSLIEQAIASEIAAIKGYDYTTIYKRYPINDPAYTLQELPFNQDFVALADSLPKTSKYLLGDDTERIRFHAQYWPREAVEVATNTLTLKGNII